MRPSLETESVGLSDSNHQQTSKQNDKLRSITPPVTPINLEELGRSPGFQKASNGIVVRNPAANNQIISSSISNRTYQKIGQGGYGCVVGVYDNFGSSSRHCTGVIKQGEYHSLRSEFFAGKLVDEKFFITARRFTPITKKLALLEFSQKAEFDLLTLFESPKNFALINIDFAWRLFAFLDLVNHSLIARNLCHRDIKPENIVVMANGDFKIIDLAMLSQLNERVMTVAGSLDYCSLWVALQQSLNERAKVGLIKTLRANEMSYDSASIACVKVLFSTALYLSYFEASSITHKHCSAVKYFVSDFSIKRKALINSATKLIISRFSKQGLVDYHSSLANYENSLKVLSNYIARINSHCYQLTLNTAKSNADTNFKPEDLFRLNDLLKNAKEAIQVECEDFGIFITKENFRSNMESYQSRLFKKRPIEACHDGSNKKLKSDVDDMLAFI